MARVPFSLVLPASVLLACSSAGGTGASDGGPSGNGGAAGGAAQSGGSSANGGASGGGGTSTGGAPSGGGASNGGTANDGGAQGGGTGGVGSPPAGSCPVTSDRVRITEIDLGGAAVNDEDEAALHPLVISPMPSGGSRLAWYGEDGQVHVTELDGADRVTGTPVVLPAHDFSDLYADDAGGVLLLSRDAEGGGVGNCGAPTNLCGTPPAPPIPCFDMYLVRFDGAAETWATKLTTSSAALPPYSTSATGPDVFMIWWYAHHGRIASDGSRYAGYYGTAISVSQGGCINIHQGDRMQIVSADGTLESGGFDLGCSHSGYERVVWDPSAAEFVAVCKTDNQNRIAIAPRYATIAPVDLSYSNLGNVVLAGGGGYWLTASDIRPGQPAGQDGFADVHLLHFGTGAADRDIVLASDANMNDRAPHLAAYGTDQLLAAWEVSPAAGDLRRNDGKRQLTVQALDRTSGAANGAPLAVGVRGNRYQDFVAFPDGSVAFAGPGSSSSKVQILRILSCSG